MRSLKAALDDSPQDAYFVITKRPDLLGHPHPLQRWLDYLAAQVSRAQLPEDAANTMFLVPYFKPRNAAIPGFETADSNPTFAPRKCSQSVGQRDIVAFLLAAPGDLFAAGTLHQAGAVVTWLRTLGVKPEFMWSR